MEYTLEEINNINSKEIYLNEDGKPFTGAILQGDDDRIEELRMYYPEFKKEFTINTKGEVTKIVMTQL